MKIIILPGWQHSAADWSLVTKQLEKYGHTVHALTLPGFGDVPLPANMIDLQTAANWVETEILKIVSASPFVLCGHSYGGRLAVELCARGRLPISKMILVGSPNLYRPTRGVRFKKGIVRIFKPIAQLLPEHVRRTWRSADFEAVRGTPLEQLYQNVFATEQAAELAQCKTETLVICGEEDEAVPPATARAVTNLLPHGAARLLPGVGHNIHFEKPTLLAGIINIYADC